MGVIVKASAAAERIAPPTWSRIVCSMAAIVAAAFYIVFFRMESPRSYHGFDPAFAVVSACYLLMVASFVWAAAEVIFLTPDAVTSRVLGWERRFARSEVSEARCKVFGRGNSVLIIRVRGKRHFLGLSLTTPQLQDLAAQLSAPRGEAAPVQAPVQAAGSLGGEGG